MIVVSKKLNYFENLCLKNELKVKIPWLPKKNIFPVYDRQSKSVENGFTWLICIKTW